MSESNVETIRDLFRAFDEGDYATALRLFHPEVEWNPTEGSYRGLEGLAQATAEWLEPWEEHRLEGEDVEPHGDVVVAEAHLTARGTGSGMEVDQRFFQVYRFEDGLIRRMDEYLTRDEALAAAGVEGESA